jgi:hypothetical protein
LFIFIYIHAAEAAPADNENTRGTDPVITVLPFFTTTWGSNPALDNGMVVIAVLLIVAVSILLLYFAGKRIRRK